MAAFDARLEEIRQGFETAYQKAIKAKHPADVLMSQKLKFVAVLESYIAKRNEALASALRMLHETDERITEKDHKARWQKEVKKAGQEGFKMIVDLDDDGNDSFLNVYLLGLATQEGMFFNLIADMPLCAAQGFCLQEATQLEEEKEKLLGEWESTFGSAKDANARAKDAGERVQKAFNEALVRAGADHRRAAEATRDGIKLAIKAMSAKNSGGAEPSVQGELEKAATGADALVSTTLDVARMYSEAYRSNETRLITLDATRQSVKEFLNATNLEVARKRCQDAEKDALAAAASALTPGQREDAEAFAAAGAAAIKGALSAYETNYNTFVTKFEAIFIGPIGSEQLDQLIAGNFWRMSQDGVERLSFESVLRRYYDQAEDMFGHSIYGLEGPMKDVLMENFRRELRAYEDDIEKMILTYLQVYKMLYIDYPIQRLKDFASGSDGYDA